LNAIKLIKKLVDENKYQVLTMLEGPLIL